MFGSSLRPVVVTLLCITASIAVAAPEGTRVMPSPHSFDQLVAKLRLAVESNGMAIVTQASASAGARRRGVAIRGNYVAGVFRNDIAVRMLAASVEAGIEAPIRFYVTENADATATLRYKSPSAVFAPYADNTDLTALGTELDSLFAKIAVDALAP